MTIKKSTLAFIEYVGVSAPLAFFGAMAIVISIPRPAKVYGTPRTACFVMIAIACMLWAAFTYIVRRWKAIADAAGAGQGRGIL
jgi:hypothetical protein